MTESSDRDDRGRFAPGNQLGFAANPDNINRDGRPPRPSITSALLRRLNDERKDGQASGGEIVDALVQSAVREALGGSFQHLREIWTRIDGKESKGETPIVGTEPATVDEHREAAISLYRSIIIDPSATPRDKLAAQEGLNRILGLVEDQSGDSAEETAAQIRQFLNETDVTNEAVEDTQTPPAAN
jgi:hypothetical protein